MTTHNSGASCLRGPETSFLGLKLSKLKYCTTVGPNIAVVTKNLAETILRLVKMAVYDLEVCPNSIA